MEVSGPAEGDESFEPAREAPIEIDVHCLKCGYNLRGLSGDPVRCPECGHHNTRADLACPPALARARMRQMEISGLVCWLISVGAMALLATALVYGKPRFAICPLCATPFLWLIGATEFKNGSLGERGWRRALACDHAYWLGICSPLAMPGAVYVMVILSPDPWGFRAGGKMTGAGAVLLAVSLVAGVALAWQAFKRLNPSRRARLSRLALACVQFEVEALRQLEAKETR